jgi:UrcA family protein
MKMRTILAAAVLVAASQSASSGEVQMVSVNATQLTETVQYADLNLDRPQGATTLHKRLSRAAKSVCAPLRGRGDLERTRQHRGCISEALANAVAQVNQPLLTEHHRSRGSDVASAVMANR